MKKIKKVMKRVLLVGMIAGIFPVITCAQDVNEGAQEADTAVSGEVASEIAKPMYVISIPDAIDFGTLKKPASNINAYKDVPFNITMVSLSDLQQGQVVSVLVRDAAWNSGPGSSAPTSPFAIRKGDKSLSYYAFSGNASPELGNNIYDTGRWHDNGLLYGSFGVGSEGQAISGALRLNQKQLFDQNLEEYQGKYEGTLKFYTTIANVSDY